MPRLYETLIDEIISSSCFLLIAYFNILSFSFVSLYFKKPIYTLSFSNAANPEKLNVEHA